MGSSWRSLGCAVGFGFGVVWMTTGLGWAILVLLCAGLGYGAAFIAEQDRASLSRLRPSSTTPPDEDEPLLRDEFELDPYERHDEELPADELPDEEIAPVAAQGDYGWPHEQPFA